MSPRKVRLVADAIRKLSIEEAYEVLSATQKRSGGPLMKTLRSAVSNAKVNNNILEENLVISQVVVNEGQALKRFHPSSRGRVHPYKNKSSHITIVLKEKVVKPASAVKTHDKKKAKTVKAIEQSSEKGGNK
jgi:large subunit ribosomal protein L22